jgi:hypothetical protein
VDICNRKLKNVKLRVMKTTEKLSLVDSNFSNDEAIEFISKMINSKINYHNIKNWSSQERYGKDDEIAQKRIPELRQHMENLRAFLSDNQNRNKRFLISSEINITLLDD